MNNLIRISDLKCPSKPLDCALKDLFAKYGKSADISSSFNNTTNILTITVNGVPQEIPIPDDDKQTLSISGTSISISNGNSVNLTSLVKSIETITEINANGTQYNYTKEDGTIDSIQAGTFISADTGNAIATGTDGGLMLTIPAQLPDDQLLSGDNSGNIDVTLTPDPQPDGSINYLLKSDLPLATTTPNSNPNALEIDANGKFFVEPETTTTLTGVLSTGTKIGTYTNEAGTAVDLFVPASGNVVSFTQTQTSGTKIGTITIDGVSKDVFAPAGGASADGSETKLNAGTGVTITGSGTIASPYIINGSAINATNVVQNNATTNLDVTVNKTTASGVDTYNVSANLPLATFAPSGFNSGLGVDSSGNFYAEVSETSMVRMSRTPGTQQNIPAGTADIKVIAQEDFQVGNTSLLIPKPTLSAVVLKAGFDYSFSAQVSCEMGAAGNTMTFQFMTSTDLTGATAGIGRQLVGTIKAVTSPSLFVHNPIPSGIWSPNVDTLLWLACINSVGAGNKLNMPSNTGSTGISWFVQLIGKSY